MTRHHHVTGAARFQPSPRMLVAHSVGISMDPLPVLVPFIIEASFGGPLAFRSMVYDAPLVLRLSSSGSQRPIPSTSRGVSAQSPYRTWHIIWVYELMEIPWGVVLGISNAGINGELGSW
ncbi:hypothetical protein PIB30_072921 [Stylosanthes scabra]|uniref:Uncharacterized protein n=1 Tax=Stylosanthes scabra TaxID=79078 RepID=A0ABU6VQ61_9FABA|nr:hypothetical protein [Stylosanthes scabra]